MHYVKRWLARILYTAACLYFLHLLAVSPYTSDAPVLSRALDVPLSWAVTADVAALNADAPNAPSPSVAEPDPEPAPEPREPGDIFGLMYHDLTTDESQASTWRTTPDRLRENLEELHSLGYSPLSIEEYISGDYEIGPDYYILTFDDGYIGNLTLGEPLLSEMGVPAVLFVITGSTELDGHMSWDELKQMQEHGVISIYSHTHSHISASGVSLNTFLKDTETAWSEILTHLDEPEYKILSYPNGAYTRESMRRLAKEGYVLFTIQENPWWYKAEDNEGIRYLRRLNVGYDTDITELTVLNRKISGVCTLEEKFAEIARKEAEALAAERATRRAWLEGKMQ